MYLISYGFDDMLARLFERTERQKWNAMEMARIEGTANPQNLIDYFCAEYPGMEDHATRVRFPGFSGEITALTWLWSEVHSLHRRCIQLQKILHP